MDAAFVVVGGVLGGRWSAMERVESVGLVDLGGGESEDMVVFV